MSLGLGFLHTPGSWVSPLHLWGHLQGPGNGGHSLDADTLHVLGAPGIDVALRILEGLKRVMTPIFLGTGMGRGAHHRVGVTGGILEGQKGAEEGI